MTKKISFYSLKKTHEEDKEALVRSFGSILDTNWFVLGESLIKFESEFARYTGTRYAVGTGNGYDALKIALKAFDLKPGVEVIVPAHTFTASILAIIHAGLKPHLTDIDPDDYTLDLNQLEDHVNARTRVILPVHIYGIPAKMDLLSEIARRYSLYVAEDFAQSTGGEYKGRKTGSFGDINATSFYPVKTLGALGDGGMITTNREDFYERALQLRNYGMREKYKQVIEGYNSRLDEIQAAFLSVKLKKLDHFIRERKKIAQQYTDSLSDLEKIHLPDYRNASPSYHIFPVRTPERDQLRLHLQKKGIETIVHYPIPPHLQPGLASLGYKKGDFPVTEEICKTELSLPVYPGLIPEEVNYICENIHEFFRR